MQMAKNNLPKIYLLCVNLHPRSYLNFHSSENTSYYISSICHQKKGGGISHSNHEKKLDVLIVNGSNALFVILRLILYCNNTSQSEIIIVLCSNTHNWRMR